MINCILIFRDNKKTILYSLLLLIAITILNVYLISIDYIKHYIDYTLGNKEINRVFNIVLNSNTDTKKIEKILNKNVDDMEYFYYSYRPSNSIYYKEYNIRLDNYKKYNNIKEDEKAIVISNALSKLENIKVSDTMTIRVKDKNFSYKVIGIIDDENFMTVYLNDKNINNIYNYLDEKPDNIIFKTKNYKSTNKITDILNNNNIKYDYFDLSGKDERDLYNSFAKILSSLAIVIYLIIIYIIYWIIKDIYNHEIKDISLKRLIGYSKAKCLKDMLIKGIIYICISFALFLVILLSIKTIDLFFIKNEIINSFLSYSYMLKQCICNILLLITIYIVVFALNIKKIVKIDPIYEITKE